MKGNILIAGGSGFVGKHLIHLLRSVGYTIIVIDKDDYNVDLEGGKIKFYKRYIGKDHIEDIFLQNKIDVVVNLIGRQYVDTKIPYFGRNRFFIEGNVVPTKNLLDSCLKHHIDRFIFISTDMVYGYPKYIPIDEKHPCNPVGEYGYSKLITENLINTYSLNYNIKTLILRTRFIIGKDRGGVLKTLIKLFTYNLPVPLFGQGRNHYQMINVKDVVDFIKMGIENKNILGIVNLGSDDPPIFKDFYKLIKKKLQSHSIIFTTWHILNKFLFKNFDAIGIPLLYKDQYKIVDKEYILTSDLAKSYGWKPKINDLHSALEVLNCPNDKKDN